LEKNVKEILTPNGTLASNYEEIKEAVVSHFVDLDAKKDEDNMEYFASLLHNIPSLVSLDENLKLTKEVSKEEIKKVIWELTLDKSPSPDGFTIHFYKICWNTIKFDLIHMIKYVQKSFKIGGEINSNFLALIPKEENPSSFSRFWPISLCNVHTK
jgi:hypothetical protein